MFCLVLFLIYFPMAAGCYFALGDVVQDNIVLSMPGGWEKVTVEIMLLLHLITAYPIITNPPAQFFEEVFNIPSSKPLFCTNLPLIHTSFLQISIGRELP